MGKPETRAVDKRMRFVAAVEAEEETVTALCRRFGFSRKTGYKWLERYCCGGIEGLADRSRAPHEHPQAVATAIAERCLAVRHAHPTWGPVKVCAWLERHDRAVDWPAASTIGVLFDRAGLTVHRKLRRQALGRNDTEHVWPVLDAAFREYGLPVRLRSDNGPPFASTGAAGLSRLAVKVIKAGVWPERIAPGKPEQNGRLERLHLTLLRDTAAPPARTLREQLDRLRAFQRVYNEERPHAALGWRAARARVSGRPRFARSSPQRCHSLARRRGLSHPGAGRRDGRPRRARGWRLGRALRPDRARHHRPSRPAPAQAQT